MKLLTHIPHWIKNKFFIALALFAFILLFFDKSDLFTQLDRARQLRELEASRQYYIEQIAAVNQELERMKSDPGTLEKYSREKYLMKRDNEDLFVIPENYEEDKN